MGQAKLRGTRDERAAQALIRDGADERAAERMKAANERQRRATIAALPPRQREVVFVRERQRTISRVVLLGAMALAASLEPRGMPK